MGEREGVCYAISLKENKLEPRWDFIFETLHYYFVLFKSQIILQACLQTPLLSPPNLVYHSYIPLLIFFFCMLSFSSSELSELGMVSDLVKLELFQRTDVVRIFFYIYQHLVVTHQVVS